MKKYLFLVLIIFHELSFSVYAQWTVQSTGLSSNLKSVCFPSADLGFAVGENKILRTSNSGSNWSATSLDAASVFESVYFLNEQTGWVVGNNGSYDSGVISKTTNGGETWSNEIQILGPSDLNTVFFVNNTIGYAAGLFYGADEAIIGKTTDGGTTWNALSIPYLASTELFSAYFTDENHGWVVGWNHILSTTDGGQTWSDQYYGGLLSCVYFSDAMHGWIAGAFNILLRTTDGGNNWVYQSTEPYDINSIHFIDANNGWLVGGPSGVILRTTNGGQNWQTELCPTTNNLAWVNFPPDKANIGWAVGGNTVIKREQFSKMSSITIDPVERGAVAWGDYDNDNDLDFLITGYGGNPNVISKIYKNNGNSTFTEQSSLSLTGVENSAVAWGDYDNDGWLDILLTGRNAGGDYVSKIYRNMGNNSFNEQTSISITGIQNGSVDWGDYNNDGLLDFVMAGQASSGAVSKIYKNNGDNTFTDLTGAALIGVYNCSVAWSDYDNDGDADILISGYTGTSKISKIYRNDGNDTFTDQTTISLTPVDNSSAAWGDYDGDGDPDILLTGRTASNDYASKIYRNMGNNTFTEQSSISLTGVDNGSTAWGDYDDDGDLDILLTGRAGTSNYISKIYENTGNNSFSECISIPLMGVSNSSVAWGDFDNDRDLDILLTGLVSIGFSSIYRNNNIFLNNVPSYPGVLISYVNLSAVALSWQQGSDPETPVPGLSYNLVIGSSPGASDILSPMSDRSTGYRKIVKEGNAYQNNNRTIVNLPNGTYYWSVQALDNNYAASEFAPEKNFTINVAPVFNIDHTSIAFGNVVINTDSTKNFTVTNNGNGDLIVTNIQSNESHFSVIPASFTVQPGESQLVSVTFTPTAVTSYSGFLTITHNAAGSPSQVNVSGNGVNEATAIINISTTDLPFGNVPINNSSQKTFTIENDAGASADLEVTDIQSNNSSFTVTPTSFTLNPGGSQEITVTFSPSQAVYYEGNLSIYHNAAGSPSHVNVDGTGVNEPVAIIQVSTQSISFGNVTINNSSQRTFTVQNEASATADLEVTDIQSSDTAFTVSPKSFILSPGAGKTVTVTFLPTQVSDYSSTLSIFHNASGSPTMVSLSGNGVQEAVAICHLSTTTLSFGELQINNSLQKTFDIENEASAAADLEVSGIESSSDVFSVAPDNFILAPGASRTITVTFTPVQAVIYNETITITHNASGSPSVINVSGTGVNIIQYPDNINLVTSYSFGDFTKTSSYRMIGFPAINDRALNDIIGGQYGKDNDWRAFTDPGSGSYIEFSQGSAQFNLQPGHAFWVLSKNAVNVNISDVPTVQLDADNNYSVQLHSGWNLISDPFEIPVNWSDIVSVSQGINQPAWTFLSGTYDTTVRIEPYKGYYFNNTSGISVLKIPYMHSGSINKTHVRWVSEPAHNSGGF